MEEKLQVLTEKHRIQSRRDEAQQAKQQAHLNQEGPPAPVPPSPSSSPSHEFSFATSLEIPPENKTNNSSPSPPPFAAVDLSPADEIFFHGHLLPLHLLSQLPASPRASMDSFTLPIKELLPEDNSSNSNNNKSSSTRSSSDDDDEDCQHESRHVLEAKNRGKSKSFSLFGNMPKWKKLGFESKDEFEDNQHQKIKSSPKWKSRFEFLKKYVGLILPFLSNRGRGDPEFRRGRYSSYSGNLRFRSKRDLRGRRGEFSAPATMKTSPANSGILMMASGAVTPTSKSDSTMEELQAAIQAAIAHCKNSIAATQDQNQAAMKS